MSHPEAIPNARQAVIHPDKLRKYVLNPLNEIGAHKARVFKSALGFTQDDADELASQLLSGLPDAPAIARKTTEYGTPYSVVPRLVSAYVIGG